jgi:prolyl 4-hydroxylase
VNADLRARLIADAAAGNRVAERLLLLMLVAAGDNDEIAAMLARIADTGHRRFVEAELCCFHSWPGELPWQDALRQCAAQSHGEARAVVTIYDAWGWDDWQPPEWSPVVADKELRVERSAEFAPPILVNTVRNLLGPQLRPSAVIDPDTGKPVAHPVRINQCAQWYPEHLGWVGKLFEKRLAAAGGFEVSHGEVPSLLHYTPGQRYKAHLDCISDKQAESREGLAQGGQRTLTILLALGDDDYEGGETWFPQVGAGAKAAAGRLLRFNNTGDDGQALRSSLHAGQPITAGEKWLLSKWVRERETPYGREICLGSS